MRVIASSDARADLAGTLNRVVDDREPVVVTRGGREPVVILALDDYEAMQVLLTPASEAGAAEL